MTSLHRSYSTTSLLTPVYSIGFCISIVLANQLLTGLLLACDYNADSAFTTCCTHLRDLDSGWLTRNLHAVGASVFLGAIYIHIGRCLYYASPSGRSPVWSIGLATYFLVCGACFTGYSLVYGQMSLWAIVVISNLVAAVLGDDALAYLWGCSVVSSYTLNRFFVAHYILPFVATAFVLVHLVVLHSTGSTGDSDVMVSRTDKVSLVPTMLVRDLAVLGVLLVLVGLLTGWYSDVVGHCDNWIPGNALVTPPLIAPEWYLLPFYGVLRAVPSKLLGVLTMALAMIGLAPMLGTVRIRNWLVLPTTQWTLSLLVVDAVLAGYLCLECNSLDVLYGGLVCVVVSWMCTQLAR